MTTTAKATAAAPILAIDLGKYKCVACLYGGFVPRQYQSTDTDYRGRITKRGPKTLRKLLVECAWVMLRYNPWARAVYQRLTHGGKTRKKQAIVAIARKLLVRCWAMLRDGTTWRADPVPAAT
jgi:transposase